MNNGIQKSLYVIGYLAIGAAFGVLGSTLYEREMHEQELPAIKTSAYIIGLCHGARDCNGTLDTRNLTNRDDYTYHIYHGALLRQDAGGQAEPTSTIPEECFGAGCSLIPVTIGDAVTTTPQ